MAANPYAQASQSARLSMPLPVDRNPYLNEAPAPAAEPPPAREVSGAVQVPSPPPAPLPAPVVLAEKQPAPAVVAQTAAALNSAPPASASESPAVRKDLDPEQVKAILEAQKALLAQINANDEKIAVLEAQKAAAMSGQLAPEPTPSTEAVVAAPPADSGEAVAPLKKNQWWQETKPVINKIWIWFLVLNLGVFLFLNFKTDFRIFTNITDLKFCLVAGIVFILSKFTESKAHPVVEFLFTGIMVFGLAWHTFKANASPAVAFFLVFAKYAMVHLVFVYIFLIIFGVIASIFLAADRKMNIFARLIAMFAGFKTMQMGGSVAGSGLPFLCQDPVNVSIADYFKGVSSRKQPYASATRTAVSKASSEEPSMG
ncbi:hypothetical protein LC612_40120 [Nostoc sp. CHAB 5834]|nr:hypothetical protein [Nostoc sp. CHAB 5834]